MTAIDDGRSSRKLGRKAALCAGLFLAGGLAGAGTASLFELGIEEVDLPGDEKHVTIYDEASGEVIDEMVVPDDTSFFAIEDGGPLLGVRALDDEPEELDTLGYVELEGIGYTEDDDVPEDDRF